jgi:two-component system response regulator YesN
LKRSSFVQNLMLSCLIMLLVPIGMGALVYLYTSERFSDTILENNEAVLMQAQSAIEDRLASMDNITQSLSNNGKLPYFALNRTQDAETYLRVWEFQKDLKQSIENELFVRDIYVFFYNNDIIVSNNTAYKKSNFYGRFFTFDNLSYDEFMALMEGTYYEKGRFVADVTAKTELINYRSLAYVRTIPVNISRKYTASVLLLIDEAKLKALLDAVEVYDTGYAYMLDGQGQVMISKLGPDANPEFLSEFLQDAKTRQQINGVDMTFVHIKSPVTGWQFVAALPTHRMLAQPKRIQLLTVGSSLCSLVMGLFVAYLLLKRHMHPLAGALDKLVLLYRDESREETVKQPFKYVGEKVQTLFEDNQRLQYSLRTDRRLLKRLCISAVLRGDCPVSTEMLKKMGISGNWYCAATALVDPQDCWEASVSFISEFKFTGFDGKIFFVHHDKNVFYALMCFGKYTPQECMEQAERSLLRLDEQMKNSLGAGLQAYCGRICPVITEVAFSLYDAVDLSRMPQQEPRQIAWYSGAHTKNNTYYYSIETEMRLIELVRAGKSDSVAALLDMIQSDNLAFGRLSLDMTRRLFDELQGTLLKVSGDVQYCNLPEAQDYEELFSKLAEQFLAICQTFKARRNQSGDMGTRMLEYIDTHFTDRELSLKKLSEVFDLNESYASKYFKTCTGVNFFYYLEGLRIREAHRLLSEGACKIKEVAQRVGYLDDKSFRRAYKKRMGDTPGSMIKEEISL